MKQKLYLELKQEFKRWKKSNAEYFSKRRKLIKDAEKDKALDEDELERLLTELEKVYHHDSESIFKDDPLYWGPTVIITEHDDLVNKGFKLPGFGKSFKELGIYPEILEYYNQVVNTKQGKVKILGFAYDGYNSYIYAEDIDSKSTKYLSEIDLKA